MTDQERDVILKATSLVRWKREQMMETDPYSIHGYRALVDSVDTMQRVADSHYGGFEWRVVQVVLPLQEKCTWERRNHAVYGPDSWDLAFFKLVCRTESEKQAKVVAAFLDGLECNPDGDPIGKSYP